MGRKRKQDNIGCGGAILLLLAIVATFNYIYEFVVQNTQIVLFFLILLGVIFGLSAVLSVATKVKHSKAKKRAEFELKVKHSKAKKRAEFEFTRDLIITNINGLKQTRAKVLEDEKRIHALQLADVDHMDGIEFELYVGKLLTNRGFQVEVTQASNDLGVDIIARKDDLNYAIQVKRQANSVSRRAVSDAVAGKNHYGCNAAMVVTNNHFARGAVALSKSTGCELIDRDTLAKWVLDFQTPETVVDSEEVLQLDARIAAELSQLVEIENELNLLASDSNKIVEQVEDKVQSSSKPTPGPTPFFSIGQWLTLILLGMTTIGVISCLMILMVSR